MAADFSRVRTDPLRDYAGIELKQGGVLLDADANELVAVLDRRLRALASDTLGRATVSQTTPTAFQITLGGPSGLQIGRGRMYVDGLLAENHGAKSADPAQQRFDPLLAEAAFTNPIDYAAQPYLPSAPTLPEAGRHLVYLNVWNRELTHLERPDLVETAVGVETSSRLQTVWQVRVLDETAGDAGCDTPDADVPGWAALIAPSAGRLTTGTFDVAPSADPCELPPTGGYRGLENQLYRVEIHDGGTPGAGATFKWSRDNASVGSRVASMVSASDLELESLGRDDVLRFDTDDWVEITDDVREFSQRAGEMRRIVVDEANRRISFTPALPPEMLPAAFPDSTHPRTRNLRVRRWDQNRQVFRTGPGGTTVPVTDLSAPGSPGVIEVPAAGTTLLLEHGLTVAFDIVGTGGLRPGDWWVFAARTGDASVERLERAPPRGIHHHYARLGFWDIGAEAITDCRGDWPPSGTADDCSCGRCVTPESHASGTLTIQAAVDALRDRGGTVCIAVGIYALREPVRITSARAVRIRGQGPATVLTTAGGAFAVDTSAGIAIERLAVISLGALPAIAARGVAGFALHELLLAVFANRDNPRAAAIELGGVIAGASVADNLIIAPEGIRADTERDDNERVAFLLLAAARFERNILWCQRRGIAFDRLALHLFATSIESNEVIGCREGGIACTGLAGPGASLRVARNSLQVNGPGITSSLDGTWIGDNKLHAVRQGDRDADGAGITLATGLDTNGPDQAQVLANQVRGFADGGIVIGAPVQEAIVKLNIIESCGAGIVMADEGAAGAVSIENNHLRDIGPPGNEPRGPSAIGIAISRTDSATIAGNTIRGVGAASVAAPLRAGILGVGVQRMRISGNEISRVGPPSDFAGIAAGILLRPPYANADLSANHIERDAEPAATPGGAAWQGVLIDDATLDRTPGRIGSTFTVRVDAQRSLVFNGARAFVARASFADAAGAIVSRGSSASLRGNTIDARGREPAVEVVATGELMFSDNRVHGRSGVPAVRITSPVVLLNANRVTNLGDLSVEIVNPTKTFTAVGNLTSGQMRVAGGPLGNPWDALNIRG